MKKYILPIGILLCGTVLSTSAYDQALTSRHLIWCLVTIALAVTSKDARVNVMALCYLAFVFVSGLFAANISEWFYVALRAMLFVTYLSIVKIDRKLLAKTVILLGVIYIIYFWIDYSRVGNFPECKGLMKQRNYWAFAHFLVIPFCYYAVKNNIWKKVAVMVGLLMVTNILLLASRTALVALFAAGCASMVDLAGIRGWTRRDKTWAVASVVALVVIMCFLPWGKILNSKSMHYRMEQWKPTVVMIVDNPAGVGNWHIEFPAYAAGIDYPDAFDKENFRFPHNDYLWIFAEIGILGGLCYIAMFGVAIREAFRNKETWLLMALCGYMASAMFTAHHERPFASMMIATLLAGYGQKINLPRTILIFLVGALVVFGYRHRSNVWNKKLRHADGWQEVIECTKGRSVFSTLTFTGLPYDWWEGTALLKLNKPEQAAPILKRAYYLNPNNVHVINGFGISKAINKDSEGAEKQFNRALEICPDFKDAKDNLNALH